MQTNKSDILKTKEKLTILRDNNDNDVIHTLTTGIMN